VRSATSALAANFSAEDQMVQSCPEASPMKWHQAHTTWFFETFVLRPFLKDYKPIREEFHWLFNSYYNSLGQEIPDKGLRSVFSRPSLDEVLAFRAHIDEEMDRFLASGADEEATRRIVLGLNHEQQHQELALTDIKHAFFSNPLCLSYMAGPLSEEEDHPVSKLTWHSFDGGLVEIGYPLRAEDPLDFCFDNETPRHNVFWKPSRSQTAKSPAANTWNSYRTTHTRAPNCGFPRLGYREARGLAGASVLAARCWR
jgi:hypothetical protein